MNNRSLPIGVFDSGVGGLTVVREIIRNLPNEKIIYFGDTARVPYGNKSKETVIRYSRQITSFLTQQNVKAIVVACNTASALALDTVRTDAPVPMLGVVVPGAAAAVKETRNHKIGVIGTSGTVSSGLYEKYIRQLDPEAQVFTKACPLFVNLVEEGMIDDPVTVMMIHRYLDELVLECGIDTLILGCTHYPLLLSVISRELGAKKAGELHGAAHAGGITLVNPAYETALALKRLLEDSSLSAEKKEFLPPSAHRYFVSDGAGSFRSFAENILKLEIGNVETETLV